MHLPARAHVRCRVRLDPSPATGQHARARSERGSRMSRRAARVSSPSCSPTTGARPSPARPRTRTRTQPRSSAAARSPTDGASRLPVTLNGEASPSGRGRSRSTHSTWRSSPDEVADAAAALGEAHQLMGDGSPAMAAFRVAADALIAAGAPDPIRAAYLCARTHRDPGPLGRVAARARRSANGLGATSSGV